jgi:curved DNA-binding protein
VARRTPAATASVPESFSELRLKRDWRGNFALANLPPLQFSEPDHYAALGLDRGCTAGQIREAYRLLAKQHHPDVNSASPNSIARTQEINIAHEILSDPKRRRDYDRARSKSRNSARSGKIKRNLSQDTHVRIEDFLRGTTLEMRVNDPANADGPETYSLTIPPETAPGTRIRVPRTFGGFLLVRVLALPSFRFKVRGSDLRCDLRITAKRATQGGDEMIAGISGARLRVKIPAGVTRGEIIRLVGEGLPKARGGRGDLLVRIIYRPEIKITRNTGR